MKRLSFVRTATLMAATAAVVTGLFAAFSGSADAQSLTGIRNTKHNLSKDGPGINKTTDVGEICVFCHTPHGSSTTAVAPLWNKKLANPADFAGKMYSSQTFDGADTVGFISSSVSLACLSCHDGTQAMDTVLNAPGSGGYNANGATFAGGWSGANQSGGKMTGLACLMCDGDLKNDHPVGMEYANWNNAPLDKDFAKATKIVKGGLNVWYVEAGAASLDAAARDKKDMFLYTRNINGTDTPYVECASCHDPHSDNATFLRIPNTNSQVCLTCHTK
ncbi:cytochrome c3 family protein [Azospirillum sp. sgz301742]